MSSPSKRISLIRFSLPGQQYSICGMEKRKPGVEAGAGLGREKGAQSFRETFPGLHLGDPAKGKLFEEWSFPSQRLGSDPSLSCPWLVISQLKLLEQSSGLPNLLVRREKPLTKLRHRSKMKNVLKGAGLLVWAVPPTGSAALVGLSVTLNFSDS